MASAPVVERDPDADVPIMLRPVGRSGRLRIEEGPAHVEIKYDERGAFQESIVSVGDHFVFAQHHDTGPFHLDPQARPPQVPPLSMLTRDDLRPDGHRVEELVEQVLALRPGTAQRGRVFVPIVQPGNVTGAWARGLDHLREAAWEGRIPNEDGWVVIDAWNGTAIAAGTSLERAFEAWRRTVARVQPLPPVERPRDDPPEDLGPEPPRATFDEETKTAVFGFRATFEILPPVIMEWPEPRPENVPAIAVPLSRAPPVPDAFAAAGFERVVRLFGEYGDSAFAFLRDEPDGFLVSRRWSGAGGSADASVP